MADTVVDHAADRANEDGGPCAHKEHRHGLCAGHEAGPAIAQGGQQLCAEAGAGGGQGLHLVQGDIDGAAGDLIAVPVQLALPALDLVLHIAQAGLDLQQVGQGVGLGLQLLQAGALGGQAGQPGLGVHIPGGDILRLLVLVGHAAGLGSGGQKALVAVLGHPQSQTDAPYSLLDSI